MKSTTTYLYQLLVYSVLFLSGYTSLNAQVKNDLEVRYQSNIRGDITFIANNIISRDDDANDPEDPYNLTGNASQYNDRLNMQYIDIDEDASTFSSSSATLNMTDLNCTKIRYAGLYWGAVYPFDGDNKSNGRSDDYDQIKFSIPGGTYQDITADEIIFDGLDDPDFGSYSPYICYKDVTSMVTALGDPRGTYTVANVRAAAGGRNVRGGISGGWTLIIVYENPTMPAKNIATFDGYAGIKAGETVDVPFSGFKTLPNPFPVNASLGVATLEGDNRITGDGLSFKADSKADFTPLGDALNPANNFFNSNITHFENDFVDRNPNSLNTLGWDTDLIRLDNPANSVLPNDETGATLRATSTGDKYDIFFTSLAVEVIEPDIRLTKIVEDLLGNDITGTDVTLGQEMFYVLGFQNVGNDDAVNFTLRDVLPVNVDPILDGIELPASINGEEVTFAYDPETHEIVFNIPDTYIEEDDPYYEIKLKVKVLENCFGLRDACSNIIENTAYATYSGLINNAVISDDPSVAGFDDCGLAIPGATNFLVDLEDCNFEREEYLCGAAITLSAGKGFATYQWQVDTGDGNFVVIPGATGQTYEADAYGTYRVIKTAPAPCMEMEEIIHVIPFDNGAENPFIAKADEVVTCANDGSVLPKFYLCGTNDTRFLDVTFNDATSFEWQRLDEGCEEEAPDDCPTRSRSCTWTTVSTSEDYTLEGPGEYRLFVVYQNGCFNQFYFKAYENSLDPQVNSRDIVCNTPGNITINNIPSGYEYTITTDPESFDQETATWQDANSFEITREGVYTVFMRQPDAVTESGTACLFAARNVAVEAREFNAEVSTSHPLCPTDFGSISISVYDANPQYTYEVRDASGALVDTYGPDDDNNHTFTSLSAGTYEVSVATEDGCSYAEEVTLVSDSDLDLTARVSQHIVCDQGNILVESSGGKTPHRYAIWSYTPDGDASAPSIAYSGVGDIPASAYQTSVIFDIPFGAQGVYEFIVIDKNNCTAISNPVKIDLIPPVEYTVDPTHITCFGAEDGMIDVNVLPGQKGGGYRLSYELITADGTVLGNTSGSYRNLPPGVYELVVYQTHGNQTCEFRHEVTISQPDAPLEAEVVLVQDANCDGSVNFSSGIIEVRNSSGGTLPYAYSLDGSDYTNTSGRFENLAPGTYTVYVQDANGCLWSDNTTVITPPNPPVDIDFDMTAIVCPSLTTDVSLSVNGGEGNLIYEIVAPASEIKNNGNSNVFYDLDPDTYTFRVTDEDGCAYEENLTINAITPIKVTGNLVSNISCLGGADGELSYYVSDFSSYEYTVTDAAGNLIESQSNSIDREITITGVHAGDYTILVTDAITNCTDTAVVTVSEPESGITLSHQVTPLTCDSDASVQITASGGWGGYRFTLTGPDGIEIGNNTNGLFVGLSVEGTYTYIAEDMEGCFNDSGSFDVVRPDSPVLEATVNNACYAAVEGLAITASVVSGGTPPFEYRIVGNPWQSSPVFNSGLEPGIEYIVEVRDAGGCGDDYLLPAINEELTAAAVVAQELRCDTGDAQIALTTSGGDGNYTYEWSNALTGAFSNSGFSGSVFITNTPGTYYFRVSSGGCEVVVGPYTIKALQDPEFTLSSNPETCAGDNSGSLDMFIDHDYGMSPFTFEIFKDDGSGQPGISLGTQTTNLSPGDYVVRVTDAKGCSALELATIAPAIPLTAVVTGNPLACQVGGGISRGSVEVSVTSGTLPLTVSIEDVNGQQATTTLANPYVIGSLPQTLLFEGMDYGNYTVRIVDGNGCETVLYTSVDTYPDILIETSTNAGCAMDSGEMTVTADNTSGGPLGAGNFFFAIYTPGLPAYDTSLTQAENEANGWHTEDTPGSKSHLFEGLIPGAKYDFIVYDAATDCQYIQEGTVKVAAVSSLVATINTIVPVSCTGSDNGYVTFGLSGWQPGTTAIQYEVFDARTNQPVTGTSGSVNVATPSGQVPASLAPGAYYVVFTEMDGSVANCVNVTDDFIITQSPSLLQLEVSEPKVPTCSDPTVGIEANARYGTGPYVYLILDGTTTSALDPNDPSWGAGQALSSFNKGPGDYTVFVKDAHNCVQFESVKVTDKVTPDFQIVAVDNCGKDGTFSVTIALAELGTAPYRLSVNGAAFRPITFDGDNRFVVTGLSAGIGQTFELTDANACPKQLSFDLFPPLDLSAVPYAHPGCDNSDGIISYEVKGGSGNFTIELLNSSGDPIGALQDPSGNPGDPSASPGQFAALAAGTYTLRVTDHDSNLCAVEEIVVLEPAPAILPMSVLVTAVSCSGYNDGSITVEQHAANEAVIQSYTLEQIDGIGGVPGGTLTQGPQASNLFNGLPAGYYRITALSSRGCLEYLDVEIIEPDPLMLHSTMEAGFSCDTSNGISLATVTLIADGGTPAYSYSQDGVNFRESNTFYVADTGVAQNLNFYVRDANGCETTDEISIQPLNVFEAAVITNVKISCDNSELVTVEVNKDDGDPSNTYTFELLPLGNVNGSMVGTPGDTSATFELYTPGDYVFRVIDNRTGCFVTTIPYTVAPYQTIGASLSAHTSVSCFGGSGGELLLQLSGYSGNYEYSVFDGGGNMVMGPLTANTNDGPAIISGLKVSNYYVEIEALDMPFCSTVSNSINVQGPDSPVLADLQISRVLTCEDPGEIIAYAGGGSGDFEYQLTASSTGSVLESFSDNFVFGNLQAGSYTVTVRDSQGCEAEVGITLEDPDPINADISAGSLILCEGDHSGSLIVSNVSGGRPASDLNASYTYILNYLDTAGNLVYSAGGQGSAEFSNLKAGNYSVTVTDGWGCDFTTSAVVFTEPEPVAAQLRLISGNTCMDDAVIMLSATGGTAPYFYSTIKDGGYLPMDGDQLTLAVSEGEHSYYVKDANGCMTATTNTVSIEPVAPVEVLVNSISEATCYGQATGYVEVKAKGGLGNYEYLLLDASQDLTTPVRPKQNTGEFADLPAGVYYIQVTSNDCMGMERIEIKEGTPIYASDPVITQPACPDDMGSIELNLEGGTGIYQYAISPRLDQFQEENVFYDLEPGTYTVIAQDSKGCLPFIYEIDIVAPEPLVVTSEVLLQEYCDGENSGIIALDISGGVAPYATALNSNQDADFVVGQLVFEDLAGGETYVVFVKDANGCKQAVNVTLEAPVPFDPRVEVTYTCMENAASNEVVIHLTDPSVVDVIYSLDGGPDQFENIFTEIAPGNHQITASYQGCVRILEFEIDAIAPLELSLSNETINLLEMEASGGSAPYTYYVNGEAMGSETSHMIRETGTYEVVVVDAKGCESRAELYLAFYDLDIPNFFTPDGDSKNDLWAPENAEAYDIVKTIVYDRYGRVVGEMHVGEAWDGTYNGNPLPAGDYWYVLVAEEKYGPKEYVGHFTLYR